MRWLLEIAGLITALGLLGGVVMYRRLEEKREAQIDLAAAEVHRFQLEIKYRSASRIGELNARGWPVTIDPNWFDGRAPQNFLLSPDRPWVEVARPEEAGLKHPPVRMAVDPGLASFWYNPYEGVIRARVPVMETDEGSLSLYNRLNDCSLGSIFEPEKPSKSLTPAGASDGAPEPGQTPKELDPTKRNRSTAPAPVPTRG